MAIFEGISAAFNVLGALDKNKASEESAQSAQAFSAQQYATRYQTQVKDMQAAGLNPMLSYSQSPGGGPVGVAAQTEGFTSGAGAQALSGQLIKAQIDNVHADTEGKLESASLLRSQVRRNNAGAGMEEALTPGASANQAADTTLKGAQGELAGASAAERRQAIEESRQRINQSVAEIQHLGFENSQLEALIKEIGERTRTYGAHINLMTVQAAAERAGIPLKRAEALQITSTLPSLISQMANHARLTGLEADRIVGDASFGSGIGGQVKPWVSMIGDLVPSVIVSKKLK